MKAINSRRSLVGIITGLLILLIAGLLFLSDQDQSTSPATGHSDVIFDKKDMPKVRSSFSPKNRDDALTRIDFEINRLKSPISGRIPENIRARELEFVKNIPSAEQLYKSTAATWDPRGPNNVGGRTRALAIDLDYNGSSNQRVLAGGISGGMYRSENSGNTWTLTTALSDHASVTCVAQDPSSRNTWYYGTGEYIGNSAGGNGNFAYFGHGLFKSTNGGASWTQLASTSNNNPNVFDDFFDFVWNIAVTSNGTVFAATYGGILRSTDGGNSWNLVLGRNQPPYSSTTDLVIAANGDIYAAMARNGTNIAEYGVFRSTNNGANWSDISPNGLSQDPLRIVLDAAPSDANTVYALVQNGNGAIASDHQLFRYNASGNSWSNLSSNIPDIPDQFGVGVFNSQGGYDLVIKVKPDNANIFWIGGTNLLRSTDGGSNYDWVGGYHPQDFVYPVHHPDNHSMAFFPNNANAMISGHDGGLSFTNNVLQQPQTWTSLNNGYLTTQFYAISIDPQSGSNMIVGGLQDNGTWMAQTANPADSWVEVFGGDGSYNDISPGGNPFYVSSQSGNAYRVNTSGPQASFSNIRPAGGQNFNFITPFALDPNNSNVMYFLEGNRVWHNSNLSGIPEGNQNPTNINWTALSNSAVANTQSTALAVATTPANRVYFGATNFQSITVLKRLDNAPSNPAGTTITPPLTTQGVYPACIAINPNNGDEIMAIFSNYEAESIWYSSNAGATWSNVEGNLGGQSGPSIRWAVIHTGGGSTTYYIAASTGVYSTTSMNGGSTSWVQEGASVIGNTVTDMLRSRPADDLIVAGTHGRGVYSASGGGGQAQASININQLNIELAPNTTASRQFQLSNIGGATLNYNISTSGFSKTGNYRGILPTDDQPMNIGLPKGSGQPSTVEVAATAGPEVSDTPMPQNPLTDILFLDDGDNTADNFIGTNNFVDFYWANEFNLGNQGYSLTGFDFYMRTEYAYTNTVYVGVYNDLNGTALDEGFLTLNIAPSGGWFNITLTPALQFNPGETFYLVVGADGFISFPAGADIDASIPNKSWYLDQTSGNWLNLNTVSGFELGAFVVRAVGDLLNSNQPPNAVANVPASGSVGQNITFDGSGSNDPDGNITQYFWDFGDGNSSNQAVATHSYSQGGNFNWSLTVTDDGGATGQTSGTISISALPSRLTVTPNQGNIAAGGSQTITANYDGVGQPQGTYTGNIQITGNGGTINLPVTVLVDNAVSIDIGDPVSEDFALHQNFPNPFNPETQIRYQISNIRYRNGNDRLINLEVFDVQGRKVRTLLNKIQAPGSYSVSWDGRNDAGQAVASGVYYYRLRAGQFSQSRKMLLVR